MSPRRQKLLTRLNWYLQSSLKLLNKSQVIHFISEVVVIDRFHCNRSSTAILLEAHIHMIREIEDYSKINITRTEYGGKRWCIPTHSHYQWYTHCGIGNYCNPHSLGFLGTLLPLLLLIMQNYSQTLNPYGERDCWVYLSAVCLRCNQFSRLFSLKYNWGCMCSSDPFMFRSLGGYILLHLIIITKSEKSTFLHYFPI